MFKRHFAGALPGCCVTVERLRRVDTHTVLNIEVQQIRTKIALLLCYAALDVVVSVMVSAHEDIFTI